MKVQALQMCASCIDNVLHNEIEFTEETSLSECSQKDCANSHLDDYANQIIHYEEE